MDATIPPHARSCILSCLLRTTMVWLLLRTTDNFGMHRHFNLP
jgi:hypothetical protein